MATALGASAPAWLGRLKAPPTIQAGQLDLSRWHFVRDGSVPLAGQWVYYDLSWARGPRNNAVLAPVPGAWPALDARDGTTRRYGFGTYEMKLRLPPAPPGDHFAIDSGQILSAYRIYANGKLIAAPGTPSVTKAGERAHSYSVLADLPDGERDVALTVELSNHLMPSGGQFATPTVGLKSALAAKRRLTEMLSLIIFGALLFTACYHIAFLRVTRAGYANFWFGVMAALFGVRMFLFEPLASYLVPAIGQDWVWRLDFAVTELLLPTASWFFVLGFPRHMSPRFAAFLTIVCGTFALTGLVGGPTPGQLSLEAFEATGILVLPYFVQAIVRSAIDKDKGASLALFGLIVCAVSAIHDVLLDNMLIVGPNFLPFGCVAFFLCLSGALTQRSHHAFVSTELLVDERTRQLHEKIAELEEARAAAVSANIAKSRFLANMSHELRTPLNAILGFSEIIRERMFGADAIDRYADYAASIHKSGSHLLGLINDILDLSKIEAGKLDLADQRVDLNEEARAALTLLEPQARRKNVRLALDLDAAGPISADARATRQILVNLLSNAVKFTPPGGLVTLSAARLADGSTTIRVADNGIGIAPEDMPHLFENFGQGRHDVRTHDEKGTGLGLPIVKGLVEAMGGRIVIDSTPDVGTTVTVLLPPHRNVVTQREACAA